MPDWSLLGVREYLLLSAGLVAIYLLLLVIRLRHPNSGKRKAAAPVGQWSTPELSPMAVASSAVAEQEVQDTSFARQLAQSAMGLELQRLQREMVQLRADCQRLNDEVRQLKATHNVSPVYSAAMSLAERGELPAGIAARCGISIGEAELVAALARGEFGATVDGELDDRPREAGN